MKDLYSVIRRPIQTEKADRAMDDGLYTFEVAMEATKNDVRKAVESIYEVHVTNITTAIVRGKNKRLGQNTGRRPNWKKATVRLADGQQIETLTLS
jgi:large subunit ribosomal protein L23